MFFGNFILFSKFAEEHLGSVDEIRTYSALLAKISKGLQTLVDKKYFHPFRSYVHLDTASHLSLQ